MKRQYEICQKLPEHNAASKEVIRLNLMLDIGLIQEDIESNYQENILQLMYSQTQWGYDPEMDTEVKILSFIQFIKELFQ